jgi:hypothetical protein
LDRVVRVARLDAVINRHLALENLLVLTTRRAADMIQAEVDLRTWLVGAPRSVTVTSH